MREDTFRKAVLASNQDPIPRDIMVTVNLGSELVEGVIQRLYREIEIVAPWLARDRRVVRLCVADGGLQRLSAAARSELLDSLAQHFSLWPSAGQAAQEAAAHCDQLGLGPGSVSRFGNVEAVNATNPTEYCALLDQGRLPIADVLTIAS